MHMTLLLRQINCIKQYIVLILLILDLIIFVSSNIDFGFVWGGQAHACE